MNIGVLVALVLALVAPARVPDDAVSRSVLTPDGPAFHYRYDGHRLAVRAERSTGRTEPNRREVVVPAGSRPTRDQTSCATWVRQSAWRVQPGLAVRVRDDGQRVRAVTVTKNVVWGVQTVMNVLTWDTDRRGPAWRSVGQFDLARVLLTGHLRLAPLPWRACLRVQGRQVSFLVWPLGRVARPSWSDHAYVRHARLPRSFGHAGRPGWYVGHVPAGGDVVYGGLRTGGPGRG